MDALTARPHILKQANFSLIRKCIKAKGTATRLEITNETKISFTTVRSLLTEMMENGEIESIGYDVSSGGRKAERYRFKLNRYYSAVFCMTGGQVHYLLVNICGEIIENIQLEVTDGDFEKSIFTFLDALVTKREIKSIAVGVPGVVEGRSYWKKSENSDVLYKVNIGDRLAQRYAIPVIMENDMNATAIGFGRCYEKEFPLESPESTNMAYLNFEKDCISAGFICGGRVIRGCNNFAGELGLIPMYDSKLLHESISEAIDDVQYISIVINIIVWVCGILNPQYVTLGGPNMRKDCIGPISDGLYSRLPKYMFAEILYSPDVWHDYYHGMAHLAAGKMFDEVQFIKESP